ncbi:hypothetical protein LCGC14_2913890, partial [marine sediment metagenome]
DGHTDGLDVQSFVEALLAAGPGGPVCPGSGDCCLANGSPGCDEEPCCASVCAIDPYCCETEWDELCAAESVQTPTLR